MTPISKTIIFFGTDNFSLAVLEKLVENGYKIHAVITKPDSKSGRGQKIAPPPVKIFAEKHSIPVWQPNKLSEIEDQIRSLDNPIGILVSFGKIIPQSTIDLFSPGIVNIHPSLLPKYRGPSPVETAILNMDSKTAVSIMQLDSGMDSGPIYKQVEIDLSGREYAPELYEIIAKVGSSTLIDILPQIINGLLQPIPQDDSKATFCKMIEKSQAWIDFNSSTAAQAEARIRAFISYPKSKMHLLDQDIIITAAHTSEIASNILDIKCSDGKYLSIDELITENGRKMNSAAFLNGYANHLVE